MDALSPGLVQRLAKEVIYEEALAKEMIFRQGDPPDGCWVILTGSVGVYLFKEHPDLEEAIPTPREDHNPQIHRTLTEESRRPKRIQRTQPVKDLSTPLDGGQGERPKKKRPTLKHTKTPTDNLADVLAHAKAKEEQHIERFRSCEGFSTYHENSVLGIEVAVLSGGRIFGELGLQNSQPRAASIKCLEDSAFLRIPSTTYQGVVKHIFQEMKMRQESERVLHACNFFRQIERTQPGLIKELASRGCMMLEETQGQLLFRQLDPAQNCYIVLEGNVDVLIYKKAPKTGTIRAKDDRPTPRFTEHKEKRMTLTQAEAQWNESHEGKKSKSFNPWPTSIVRYKTTEGFSTFSEESKYGDTVVTLKPGAVVGELALQNNEARAATIKCATRCRFLVIQKEAFQEVMRASVQMIKFFNIYLPGLKRLEYTGSHPAFLFQRRVFPAGFEFAYEGVVAAEPAVFLTETGTIEFRRHKHISDNWVYACRNTPLSPSRLPELPVAARQSTSSRRNQRLAQLKGQAALVCNIRDDLKELQSKVATFTGEGAQNLKAPVERPETSKWITFDTLKSPEVFCTMPFLPLPVPEPFFVIATSAVDAYHLGGPVTEKLPAAVGKALRDYLFHASAQRIRRKEDVADPDPSEPST
ncbi:unnamed protein product [Effrenium voratum]|nr:unnamed protein product [Effrenium voratum]